MTSQEEKLSEDELFNEWAMHQLKRDKMEWVLNKFLTEDQKEGASYYLAKLEEAWDNIHQ